MWYFAPHQFQHIVFGLVIITILFSEHIILLFSDISSNGYRFKTIAPVTEGPLQVIFDPPFNIAPCVEFVSVGNGSQGASVTSIVHNSRVDFETFYMHGPNLIGARNISVTARATGEYVRILQYCELLPREVCCNRGYIHKKHTKREQGRTENSFSDAPCIVG